MNKRMAFVVLPLVVFAAAAAAPSTAPGTRPATAPATRPATGPATAASTAPALTPKSTLEGVYNDEQVARGKRFYLASCARCHGENLAGNDDAGPLQGADFINMWANKPLSELVEYTRLEMPADGPGRMPRKEITDIIVYLLNANGLPAGKAELSSELDVLKQIQLQVKK